MTDVTEDRRAFVGLAYRMLGSYADAEDVAQEALVRWHQHPDKASVESPRAYVIQITVRLCVDRLRASRAKREVYIGPWLPEPVLDVEDLRPSPAAMSELSSDLSVALMLTLERLSPLERAAFILHDIFDSEWSEVAATLNRNEAACRQLAARARAHVREGRPRFRTSPEAQERLLQAFGAALASGDARNLGQLLTEDVVFLSDGGGAVRAALKPVTGRDHVARLLLGLQAKLLKEGPHTFEPATINGLPGVLIRGTERTTQTVALDADESGAVHAIYIVSNPTKLRHIVPSS